MITAAAHDFASWREEARQLLCAGVNPEDVQWNGGLFAERIGASGQATRVTIPREFLALAERVSLHRDEHRWALLYRVLWRLTQGERNLLRIQVDDDVRAFKLMAQAVGRDLHKMKAFVRFRRVESEDGERFVAWYAPDHYIVEAIAPWFAARFGSMRWSILTPDRSVHWDRKDLRFGPGLARSAAPDGDAIEDLWRDYYAAIFNPARANRKAMTSEMPTRHWTTLPEAQLIPGLLASAGSSVSQMVTAQKTSAAPWVPRDTDLSVLRAAAPRCRGCELYARATQLVFGEGPPDAKVVMIGEQPGDEEDQLGHPFIGPAGRVLNQAMIEAGLDRAQVYVTNAVKHFKWIERGKRRLHAKPSGMEISACKPWLEAELNAIKPELVVCLGATAAQALMGREFRITSERGRFFSHSRAKQLIATVHPSAILRTPNRYEEEYSMFLRDLRLIADRMKAF